MSKALKKEGVSMREAIQEETGPGAVVTMFRRLTLLKTFLKPFFLSVQDFKVLVSVWQAGEPQTANSQGATQCSVTYIARQWCIFEVPALKALRHLIAGGYVLNVNRIGRGRFGREDYYIITQAGRDLLQQFYEYLEEHSH